jgi:hypothetical protein
MCVCVCVCVRACECVSVSVCVRACECVSVSEVYEPAKGDVNMQALPSHVIQERVDHIAYLRQGHHHDGGIGACACAAAGASTRALP